MDWTLRPAGREDADRLALIGAATFLETFVGILEGDAIVAHCAREHGVDAYRALLAAERSAAWIAEAKAGGAPLGYALVTASKLAQAEPGAIGRLGLGAVGQRHRRHIAAPEARVGDPVTAVDRHQRQRVRQRRCVFRAEPDTRQQRTNRKTQRLERVGEQAVLFETIAAAFRRHQFGEHARAVDRDLAAEPDVDILERDRQSMRALHRGEAVGIDRRARTEPDACEIRVEIDHQATSASASSAYSAAALALAAASRPIASGTIWSR